jgi:hypothetical protein
LNGSNVSIKDGSVIGDGDPGIEGTGNNVRIKTMHVEGHTGDGIQLSGHRHDVVDSYVEGFIDGVVIGSDSEVRRNTIVGNTGLEVDSNTKVSDNTVEAGVGIVVSGTGNTIRGNTANNFPGIEVLPGATGNLIEDNTAPGFVDGNPGAPPDCANTWKHNTFVTTGGAGAACIQ